MNAIKLPVRVEKMLGAYGEWMLIDGDETTIAKTGASEQLAMEIATDINLRDSCDALVEALGFYAQSPQDCRNALDSQLLGTINDWNRIICDDCGSIARAALAKVEELRKTP